MGGRCVKGIEEVRKGNHRYFSFLYYPTFPDARKLISSFRICGSYFIAIFLFQPIKVNFRLKIYPLQGYCFD
jgi:hypothetical protein